MELTGRVAVVTGGASGIGRAMARRFADEGAEAVVVADLNELGAKSVADGINEAHPGVATAMACNVAEDGDNIRLVDTTIDRHGRVDLFCANAGVGLGTDLETTDADWDRSFAVNTKAHYYAARRLLPHWLERGDGYFLATASAAGLLTQIGSAPYAVTKHAAVAFAEWLSVTYGDRGVKVSCLCPMGVNTNLLSSSAAGGDAVASAGAAVVRSAGEVLEPEQVADDVVETIRAERFLVLPHAQVLTFFQRKGSDYDRWLAGMRRLQARVVGDV